MPFTGVGQKMLERFRDQSEVWNQGLTDPQIAVVRACWAPVPGSNGLHYVEAQVFHRDLNG